MASSRSKKIALLGLEMLRKKKEKDLANNLVIEQDFAVAIHPAATEIPLVTTAISPAAAAISHAETVIPLAETVIPLAAINGPLDATVTPAAAVISHAETVIPLADTVIPLAETVIPLAAINGPLDATVTPAAAVISHAETVIPSATIVILLDATAIPLNATGNPSTETVIPPSGTVVPAATVFRAATIIPTAMRVATYYREDNYEVPGDDNNGVYDGDTDPDYVPEIGATYEVDSDSNHSSFVNDASRSSGMSSGEDEEDEQNIRQVRPRKGRKRKYNNQSRKDRKKKRNSNEAYVSVAGVAVEPKEFRNYECNCSKKCNVLVPIETREQIFNTFSQLGCYNAQNLLLGTMVKEFTVARKRGKNPDARVHSRSYEMNGQVVCRTFFVQTLRISTKRVNTALNKLRGLNSSLGDERGKAGGHNKLSEQKLKNVRDHISKFPRYKSHYCRNHNEAEYLAPDMTVTKMYSLYKDQEGNDPVSFSKYNAIFLQDFNLHKKPLKKDTCNLCDTLHAKINSCDTGTQKKTSLQEEHAEHLRLAKLAQTCLKEDMATAKRDETYETLTFDLQKTLPLPRIPTNIVFYKRQLWLYNCGVHSGKGNVGHCYVWVEGEAGRGAQEVASCLKKHADNCITADKNIKHLILWSDSCGGQNRNIKMTLFLKAILETHPSIVDISLKFLISGHSFLPNDSDFGDIEKALKLQQRIYTPNDYTNIMKSCRKKNPLVVTNMKSDDFLSTSQLEKSIVNRKIDESGNKINWLKIREIKLLKNDPHHILVKTCHEQLSYSRIDIKKKTLGRPVADVLGPFFTQHLSPLWPHGKPISAPKLSDLKSMMHLIPNDAKPFYRNLSCDDHIEDDIEGFGGNPDFEIEED